MVAGPSAKAEARPQSGPVAGRWLSPSLLVLAHSPGLQQREPLSLTIKEQMQVDGTPSRKQILKAWVLLETSLEDS